MDGINGSGALAAWTVFMMWIPKVLACIAILLIGWLVAGSVRALVDKLLVKIGFDRMIERGELKAHVERAGLNASAAVTSLIYYSVWVVALTLAFNVFGPNPVSDLLARLIAYLPNIFIAIVIVMVASVISSGVRKIISAALGGLSYGNLLATSAFVAILMIGVFAALDQLQIAPRIVNGLFYAVLAVFVGSSIVAIGGGGILPMRQVWEDALRRMQQETPIIQREAQNARLRVEEGGQAAAPSPSHAGSGAPLAAAAGAQTYEESEAYRKHG